MVVCDAMHKMWILLIFFRSFLCYEFPRYDKNKFWPNLKKKKKKNRKEDATNSYISLLEIIYLYIIKSPSDESSWNGELMTTEMRQERCRDNS